jgi:hypothetical protein
MLENLLDMERRGVKVPTLINRPELQPYLLEAFHCFVATSTEKQIGMAVGPIPYSAIVNWARMAGITDPDEIDDLAAVVWHADMMVSEHSRNKAKAKPLGPAPLPAPVAKPAQRAIMPPIPRGRGRG